MTLEREYTLRGLTPEVIEEVLNEITGEPWIIKGYNGETLSTREKFDSDYSYIESVGPVSYWAEWADRSGMEVSWENARFIVNAPDFVRYLLQENARLRKQITGISENLGIRSVNCERKGR